MAIEDLLSGFQRDAFAALNAIFKQYGLGTLGPKIAEFIKEGYSPDTISLLLAETTEYKQRFAGNEIRRQKGLPVLSPAEYLAVETSYRQIMRAAGVPEGFYDQASDFRKFIENDVSPQEIQSRVQAASDFINSAPQEARDAFSKWYTKGDMIAFALDPKRAEPLVGKAFQASQIAGQADRHGFDVDRQFAEDLAAAGFNTAQASQGFGTIQQNIGNDQKLAAISGTSLTDREMMNELFFNDADTTLKRERLAGQEAARFGGSSAVGGSSLGSSTSGQI